MAKVLILNFTPLLDKDGNTLYESNAFQINDFSGIHLDMMGLGSSVTVLRSITGRNFISCYHDYVGEIFDWIIPDPGIGQIYKVRVNKLPVLGTVIGSVEDKGNNDPEEVPSNVFCGSDGDYFSGSDGEYFSGKTQ